MRKLIVKIDPHVWRWKPNIHKKFTACAKFYGSHYVAFIFADYKDTDSRTNPLQERGNDVISPSTEEKSTSTEEDSTSTTDKNLSKGFGVYSTVQFDFLTPRLSRLPGYFDYNNDSSRSKAIVDFNYATATDTPLSTTLQRSTEYHVES